MNWPDMLGTDSWKYLCVYNDSYERRIWGWQVPSIQPGRIAG